MARLFLAKYRSISYLDTGTYFYGCYGKLPKPVHHDEAENLRDELLLLTFNCSRVEEVCYLLHKLHSSVKLIIVKAEHCAKTDPTSIETHCNARENVLFQIMNNDI